MFDGVRVPIVEGKSRADLEVTAERFLQRFAPECLVEPTPTPVLRIFDRVLPNHFGFNPVIRDVATGLEGITDPDRRTVTINPTVYEGLEEDDGRSRFAAAHETGHVVLHAEQLARKGVRLFDHSEIVLARRKDIPAYLDPEWQANWFAAALLMPRRSVAAIVKHCSDAPGVHMAARLKVSLEAANRRLQKLGHL